MTTDGGMTAETAAPEIPAAAKRTGIGRLTAWGNGVGVEIREKELLVTIVRVRPSETGVLGAATVTDYRTRPAAEWGTELLGFLRKMGVGHVAATVLLPRRDVLVRAIPVAGVSDRDLDSAIRLQIDSLHPFADEEVCFSHARIGKSAFALVGIVRRSIVDTWSELFSEAGIKVASFTFSAGAIYSALRLITTPPAEFLCAHESGNAIELYGESPSRPVYSATLPMLYERAISIARAELRLDPATPSLRLAHLLPRPALFPEDYDPRSLHFEENILPYATAMAGACPWLGIEANLLPPELRRASSRVRLVPTIAFAVILSVLLVLLAVQQNWADARYLAVLQHQISKYEPNVKKLEAIDRAITAQRARSQSLDEFRRRVKLDIDSLAELTKLIPPPGWSTGLDMDRQTVQISGETDQAAGLLKAIDSSPLFDRSEFTMPITKGQSGEMFRIRAQRTVPPLPPPQVPPAAQGKGPEAAAPAKPAAPPSPSAAVPSVPSPVAAGGARTK